MQLDLNLFGSIPVKEIDAEVISEQKVVPLGNLTGIEMFASGALVVGESEIIGADNQSYKPYENTGIQIGDMITSINNENIENTDGLVDIVNRSKGENMQVKYVHDNNEYSTTIKPAMDSSGEYKIGLWVRDAAARSRNINFLCS